MTPSGYGIDTDRVAAPIGLGERVRRRLSGRYPVDPFGGDAMLTDLADPLVERAFSLEVEGAAVVPDIGPAALVVSRRAGPGDPLVVRAAVRHQRRRRARVVAPAADFPVVGGLLRRDMALRPTGEDVASALRAGHVVVIPLRSGLRTGRAGQADVRILWGAVGFPVVPVAVSGGAGGPFGLPLGHHRVVFGTRLAVDGVPRDPLSAAELATAARDAVQELLERG